MLEIIDIFDANQNKIGFAERHSAHKNALWHKTFHCWIISKVKGVDCLIFQLRSDKGSFPKLLDVSAAGHFRRNETRENVTREIMEELGIKIPFKKLIYLGQRTEVIDFNEIKNREFQDIFLLRLPSLSKSFFFPNSEEVNGVFWIPIKYCLHLFSSKRKSIKIYGKVINNVKNQWEETSRTVTVKQLVPRHINYYLTISIMGQRLLKKQLPLSI